MFGRDFEKKMLNEDSEIEILIKICVKTYDMNSTLRSVVPLATFIHNKIEVQSSQCLHKLVNQASIVGKGRLLA